jgi:hypothetical protein
VSFEEAFDATAKEEFGDLGPSGADQPRRNRRRSRRR